MGTRYRWFQFRLDAGALADLSEALLRRQYGRSSSSGVRIDTSTKSEVAGEFIERREFVEQVVDPAGKEFPVPRLEFRRVPFRVSLRPPGLELSGQSAGRASFLDLLRELTPGAGIEPLAVDPMRWLALFESSAGPALVTALHVRDVPLSLSASAMLWVTGSSDVRRSAKEFIGARKGAVDRVRFAVRTADESVEVELTRNGRAAVSDHPDRLRRVLVQALASAEASAA